MYKHTCQICGMEFESPSARAKYCIYCRDKAQVMRNKAYKEKKQAGEAVAIGSEQICSICEKPYKVTAGSQKYCKECQEDFLKRTVCQSELQNAEAVCVRRGA